MLLRETTAIFQILKKIAKRLLLSVKMLATDKRTRAFLSFKREKSKASICARYSFSIFIMLEFPLLPLGFPPVMTIVSPFFATPVAFAARFAK